MSNKKCQNISFDGLLEITTLGNFNAYHNQINLTNIFNDSLKVWELFKYFITFRDEFIPPEKIISSLWPNADYSDPKRTLRALIFRLRKILDRQNEANLYEFIVCSHGCYKFNTEMNCVIDTVEFENSYNNAYAISKDNPENAIEQFKKVVQMYKGDYLSETYGYDWLIPVRNHYRRIFLQSIFEAAELLKARKKYQEIIIICEIALKYELYEEEVHLRYIEALAATGKIKQAKDHYKYVEEIFEREMGVKPSNALKQLYRLLSGEINNVSTGPGTIGEELREEFFSNSPMLCDVELFRLLYQLEERLSERYGQMVFLGVLTLSLSNYKMPSRKQLQNGMEDLKQILLTSLRKSDVITQLNEAQYLLSLPGLNVDQANRALDRIQKKYMASKKNNQLILLKKIAKVPPRNTDNKKLS